MAYEQKPNTGSLFKNDRKEQDSHPDYKGTALIDGLGECWLDAWLNTSANGTKYMSLKLKPKEARQGDGSQGAPMQRPQPAAHDTDLEDDIPFITSDMGWEHRVG